MEVQLQVDVAAAAARLGALGGGALVAALARGLAAAAHDAGSAVQEAALAAGLLGPTGNLGTSIGAWPAPDGAGGLTWLVGVPGDSPAARYAYLITDAVKEIVPRGHRYLAIPLAANRTGAGAAIYGSPRDVPELVFRGRTAGIVTGSNYTALFALVERVTVRGRDVLAPTIERERPSMAATVQAEVDKLVN